jgi:hypothetical protein
MLCRRRLSGLDDMGVSPAVEPVIKLLVVELDGKRAVFREQLADILVLQQAEEVQTVRIHDELGVLRLFPVLQIVQVAYKLAVNQVSLHPAHKNNVINQHVASMHFPPAEYPRSNQPPSQMNSCSLSIAVFRMHACEPPTKLSIPLAPLSANACVGTNLSHSLLQRAAW